MGDHRIFKIFSGVLVVIVSSPNLVIGEEPLPNLNPENNLEYKLCTSQVCNEAAKSIIENMNPKMSPCDDFYEHACGGWIKKHPTNSTPGFLNQRDIIEAKVMSQLKELLLEPHNTSDIEAVRKAKDLFQSCIDIRAIDARGILPLDSMVSANGGWPLAMSSDAWNLESQNLTFQKIQENYVRIGAFAPLFHIRTIPNRENDTENIISITLQHTVTMRRRYPGQRINKRKRYYSAYYNYTVAVAKEFGRLRELNGSAPILTDVDNVLNFEKNLSRWQGIFGRLQSPNPRQMTIEELQNLWDIKMLYYPEYAMDWLQLLRSYFHGTDVIIDVNEKIELPSRIFLPAMAHLFSQTPLRTIVNYIHWFNIDVNLMYTNQRMRDLTDELMLDTTGVVGIGERDTFCLLHNQLKHALSYMYVKKHFNNEYLNAAKNMVYEIQNEMKRKIEQVSWIHDDAKTEAIKNVNSMKHNIGYPSWYDDEGKLDEFFDKLNIESQFFENVLNQQKFILIEVFKEFRKPYSDRKRLLRATSVVRDYNEKTNFLDYPAATFQIPLFHPGLPAVVRYGGMGSLIAQDIVRGFYKEGPMQGFQNGKYVWAGSSLCFILQYKDFPSFNGYNKTEFCIDEIKNNIHVVDTTGFTISLKAYFTSKKKEKSEAIRLPGLEFLSNEQLFFYSLANSFCESRTPKIYDDTLPIVRIPVALANMNEFSKAFHCESGKAMNPEEKCQF